MYTSTWGISLLGVVRIYEQTKNISDKLFDLACNQLLFKNIHLYLFCVKQFIHNPYRNNNNGDDKCGIFILNRKSINPTKIIRLIEELVQLPNQYHCCTFQCGGKWIWVLNNDGIEFKNINCHKVTWDELLEKMSIHSHVNNSSSSLAKCKEEYRFFHHFTQYCINNNQLLFLKKAFYFITKFRREIDEWPTSWDEYTMLLARRQHINKLIGSRGFRYLIREIEKLVVITRNESRGKNCVNMSKCSARVDEFVETNIIPELTHRFSEETMEKNIRFLKQQTQWQCFVCFNINHITLDVCQHCTNTHKTRKYCVSLNPYQFFIYNESSLLDIDKQFGLIGHLPTINKMKNSTRDTIYSYSDDIYNNGSYIHSNYESNIIGIIVHLGDSLRYCIVFYENNALTLGQLKTIIYEMAVSPCGKFCQLLHVSLYSHKHFGKMKDDDIIRQTSNAKPYVVKVVDDVEINYKIRDEYMIHFGGKYCNYQCPYMKSALRKGKVKDDDKSIIINSTVILDPFIHCPYFGDKYDGDNNDEFVLDHLSSYDHFQSFGIVQKHCNLGNSCPKYQRVSKAQDSGLQNTHSSFLDKKHLYLCHHRVADARISNLVANSVNGNWYEYTSSMRAIAKLCRNRVKLYNYESNFGSSAFLIALKLIREVVMNGYIQDLLPKTEISPEFGDKEWMLCALNEMINNYQRHSNQLQGQSMRKKLDTNVKLQIEYKTILSPFGS